MFGMRTSSTKSSGFIWPTTGAPGRLLGLADDPEATVLLERATDPIE